MILKAPENRWFQKHPPGDSFIRTSHNISPSSGGVSLKTGRVKKKKLLFSKTALVRNSKQNQLYRNDTST